MADDDRKSDPKISDVVRINTERFRMTEKSRTDTYTGLYSDRWKHRCREILRIFASVSAMAEGAKKPLGATKLCKRIMHRYEGTREYGLLTVNNVYDWLTEKKGHLNDLSFSFVDEFIRNMRFSDEKFDIIKKKLIDDHDDVIRSALTEIYSIRSTPDMDRAQLFFYNNQNKLLISPIIDDLFLNIPHVSRGEKLPYKQVAILVTNFKLGVLGIKCIYTTTPFARFKNSESISRSRPLVYYGHLIPISGENYAGADNSYIKVFRREDFGNRATLYHSTSPCAFHTIGGQLQLSITDPYPILRPETREDRYSRDLDSEPKATLSDGTEVPISIAKRIEYLHYTTFREALNMPIIYDYASSLTDEYLLW